MLFNRLVRLVVQEWLEVVGMLLDVGTNSSYTWHPPRFCVYDVGDVLYLLEDIFEYDISSVCSFGLPINDDGTTTLLPVFGAGTSVPIASTIR